jgi:aspartate ammonia-lyase
LTLGCEMSAYAEALSRDRWRIYKAVERLRVINLGGTAVGTGLAAPRQFIFRVVETLRDVTGIGFARAENLIDNTQNADVFVEVSGLLKACAATLYKISTDLRILSSGPQAGIGEIHLPARQAGSSIMPGKVNPVIPEAVSQAAMTVFGLDHSLTMAAASGNLELNQFMPLIADNLLGSITLLTNACVILRRFCVEGLEADEARCRSHVESSTAVLTALLPRLGYEAACKLAHMSLETGKSIKELVVDQKLLTQKEFDNLISPEAVCRLGEPDMPARRQDDATHA